MCVCVHYDVEQELYNLRSVYGQRKRALEFCNSTFTTIGEKKFCILHLLEDVKVPGTFLLPILSYSQHQFVQNIYEVVWRIAARMW